MAIIKRKRGDADENPGASEVVSKPEAGTKSFASGKSVKDGLVTGSRQSMVAFHQQIITPHSALPLAITHPTILILQHYLSVSPTCDEIFGAWLQGDQGRNYKQAEAAVALLGSILNILTPLPFFHSQLVGIVTKLLAPAEPYHGLLNRFIQSPKREHSLLGLLLASAALNVDPPSPTSSTSSNGRLAEKVWQILVDGGSVKSLPKLLGMRRRNKDGEITHTDRDPLDRPDIRHLALSLLLPILSLSTFQTHAKPLLPAIFTNLHQDPPVTVYRILTALWDAISTLAPGAARRTALSLLDENAIEQLLRLLSRDEKEPSTGRTVSEMASAFLDAITATPGRGICFPDEGWYPRKGTEDVVEEERGVGDAREKGRKGLHNRILSNVIRRLGGKVVDDEGGVGEWVVKVLQACPELVAGYWPHCALSVEPRLNAKWIATMAYIGRIISLPLPPVSTFYRPQPKGSEFAPSPRPTPPALQVIIESILPSPLTKQHLTKGLQHTDGLVQHMTALALARALQKLARVQGLFQSIERELEEEPSSSSENPWSRRKRELEMECRKRVPDVLVVITFAQKAAALISPDSEIEDEALAARSALLTEAALRLFGLYHSTLPTIATEAKFDVGKLLVSASSANAERRARREAREGSVVSDSGSVGSVGTLGTIGMGGGFGHSRGEVKGFEALSQLHVLKLLGAVRDWNWNNKAAGSQYTYLYHILQLHLTTLQPITYQTTTTLLNHLLKPSMLFEHDPSELSIWLSSLPRLSPAISKPVLMAQQIHLLSFLDDCVRRCIKTPYRYIEEAFSLSSEYGGTISPLLMTILEQFNAKLQGQLIATDAAGVILCYLERIILGLIGKSDGGEMLEKVVVKLQSIVQDVKAKGQVRLGLEEQVGVIQGDLDVVFLGKAEVKPEVGTLELADEKEWRDTSFERSIMDISASDWTESTTRELSKRFFEGVSADIVARRARFVLHLLSSTSDPTTIESLLILLQAALENSPSVQSGLTSFIFETQAMRILYTSDKGDEYRSRLDALAAFLRVDSSEDAALAEYYVHQVIEKVVEDAKGKKLEEVSTRRCVVSSAYTEEPCQNLTRLTPWIRFASSDQAKSVLSHVAKNAKRLSPGLNSEPISQVITSTRDSAFALACLPKILTLEVIAPFSALLESSKAQSLLVTSDTIQQLLDVDSDDAYHLLSLILSSSPLAIQLLGEILEKDQSRLNELRLLSSLEILMSRPGNLVAKIPIEQMISTAVRALSDKSLTEGVHNSANRILCSLASDGGEIVAMAMAKVEVGNFGLPLSRFAEDASRLDVPELLGGISHLVDLGLQVVVRACSNDAALSGEALEIIACLHRAIEASSRLEITLHLAEPVITAVIQERLDCIPAVRFANLLTKRGMMKAGFVRQQLQLLFASPHYNVHIRPTSTAAKLPYTQLLHSLFHASTYVSCQPTFLEPLLSLYKGTLSLADQYVLSLFQLFEQNRKLSVASIIKLWNSSGIISSEQRPLDGCISLDAQKVFAGCTGLPIRRKLGIVDEKIDNGDVYDPVFVLSLFIATLYDAPLSGLDWVEVLRSNVVGMSICCLSSRDEEIRRLASFALAKTYALISKTAFQERPQMLYTLSLLRHSIPRANARLSSITTLFFAHTLRAIATPSHFLFPIASRFLLQRPTFDSVDVPLLYGMLYASGEGWKKERSWMVRLLRDGMRADSAISSMVSSVQASRNLVLKENFVSWLITQWDASRSKEERERYIELLERAVANVVGTETETADTGKVKSKSVWRGDAEVFLIRALRDTAAESVERLAGIACRLSATRLLVDLVERVKVLGREKVGERTVEYLFLTSLELQGGEMDARTKGALSELEGWAEGSRRGLGEWVRGVKRGATMQKASVGS
ncbi:nucleolar pre-ribosomal-associated protein 1, partial [Tremellales sp. Uapishka_1]